MTCAALLQRISRTRCATAAPARDRLSGCFRFCNTHSCPPASARPSAPEWSPCASYHRPPACAWRLLRSVRLLGAVFLCNFRATYFRKCTVIRSDDFPVIPALFSQCATRIFALEIKILPAPAPSPSSENAVSTGFFALASLRVSVTDSALCNFCATFQSHSLFARRVRACTFSCSCWRAFRRENPRAALFIAQ